MSEQQAYQSAENHSIFRCTTDKEEQMMSMTHQNNSIMIAGNIVGDIQFSHQTKDLKFYDATVSVPRLSGTIDNLPVLFSQRHYEQAMLIKNAPVLLKGQIRTHNILINGHSKLIVSMFVKEILPPTLHQVNDVYLYGTICREPTYRVTPFGKQICDMMIAVIRENGKSDYIPCIAWGRTAKFSSHLMVGDKIEISGRFQSRDYQKQMDDGSIATKTAYEVSIHHLQTEGDLTRQYGHDFECINPIGCFNVSGTNTAWEWRGPCAENTNEKGTNT